MMERDVKERIEYVAFWLIVIVVGSIGVYALEAWIIPFVSAEMCENLINCGIGEEK